MLSTVSKYEISQELLEIEKLDQQFTKRERKVLENFRKIKKRNYSKKYKEIVENNREIFEEPQGLKIGSNILKELILSKKLNNRENLYVLCRLVALKSRGKNIIEGIKYNLEYIQFAKCLESEEDLARGKVGLANFIGHLGGYVEANEILLEIAKTTKYENNNNYVKIKLLAYLKLVENYIHLNEDRKAKFFINRIQNYMDRMDKEYQEDLSILINTMCGEIYIDLNESDKALSSLEKAKELLDRNGKAYFFSKEMHYNLIREYYNLKFSLKDFSEEIMLKEIDRAKEYNDLIFLSKGCGILMDYYMKINNFKKYYELNNFYEEKIMEINSLNYKILIWNMISAMENALIVKKNKELLKNVLLLLFGVGGLSIGIYVIFLDYKKVKNSAYIDELTLVGNRKAFNEKMKRVKDKKYSMLLFDVDNFKKLNDTYGHSFGDEVLKNVGKVLLESSQGTTIEGYRVGGEEFAVIFENLKFEQAILESEKIRIKIQLLKWKYDTMVTITGGISQEPEGIYEKCDQLLYTGKNQGKNRIIFG
ncbi:MAG: GGDEF domain-containing protein [Cetobacterium sp.]|uniref:GGDEF domain-containing protein n=1 Tax=Cetobacterium sp. TaxID=2071632 RepID=UPI003F3E35A2